MYSKPTGELVSVAVDRTAAGIQLGAPQSIMQPRVVTLLDSRHHFDVTRDGRRFLLRQTDGQPAPEIRVMLNWTEKLKR